MLHPKQPPGASSNSWNRHLPRAAAVTGGIFAVAALILGWMGYQLVRRELPQFLNDNLSDALGRPIRVGEFKRLGPTGIYLGPALVPPHRR